MIKNEMATAQVVWIVDDDPNDTEITTRALRKAGVPVRAITLKSGESALELMQRNELPALIFLDMKMPGMGGIETLRRIKASEQMQQVPVVIVTNSTLDSDRHAALAAGADHFLPKAFSLHQYTEEIRAQVHRWLRTRTDD